MIPNIIHQMWKTKELPFPLKDYCSKVRIQHQECSYMFWTDVLIERFININYAGIYMTYMSINKYIIKSDIARLLILHHYGGIYIDTDVEIQKNILDIFDKNASLYFVYEHPEHGKEFKLESIVSNWLIACTEKNDIVKKLALNILIGHSNDPIHRSGPMKITKFLKENIIEDIHILDYKYFGPIPKRILWKSQNPLKDCIEHYSDCYGVHHYIGSWWRKTELISNASNLNVGTIFTIITPTLGRKSLLNLKECLKKEKLKYIHLILWDNKRDFESPDGHLEPHEVEDENTFCYHIKHPMYPEQVEAKYNKKPRMDVLLRAYGITMARTPFIKCMDDDTWPEENHLEKVYNFMTQYKLDFCHCLRRIYNRNKEIIGIDKFEAIGEKNMFGYTLLDNSSTFYNRKAANILSSIYLQYPIYGDDRLTYEPLKQNCKGALLPQVLTNHMCQPHLESFFEKYCTKEN